MINAILPFISIPLALATGSILPIFIIHVPAIIYYAMKAEDMPKAPKVYVQNNRREFTDEDYMHFRFVNRNCNNLRGGFTDVNVNRVPIQGEANRVANGGRPHNNPSRWV